MGNERYDKYRETYKKYRLENKEKLAEINAIWARNNRTKMTQYMRDYLNRKRYGNLRENTLERDGWICQGCGMTNEQHLLAWGRQITVNHIDGNENNCSMDNLETLCLRCHGRKDRIRGWEMTG